MDLLIKLTVMINTAILLIDELNVPFGPSPTKIWTVLCMKGVDCMRKWKVEVIKKSF